MLHQIGVGALGPVFRTYEPERDRLVAVKAFRLDITPEQARALADELSRAADAGLFHPSIVEPLGAGVEGTVAYSAEEYVAAESLDVAMRHYAPAPVDTALPFITQLAGAIDFARVAGVGHGALHPRDVFVTPDEARATGFGVVEALERIGVRAPVRRPYTAPERIAGQPWSTPADVFSLAAIAYELLTGRRPAGLGQEIGPLTAGAPNGWMHALHAVLARAMDEDPARRHPTALALASALEAVARGDFSPVASAVSVGETPAGALRDEAGIDEALRDEARMDEELRDEARMDEAAPAAAAAAMTEPPSASPALSEFAREPHAGWPEPAGEQGQPDEGLALREQEAARIAYERDDDEAHHKLILQEMNEPEGASGIPSELRHAESDADRFMVDVAGSVPGAAFADDFREPDTALNRLTLQDESATVPGRSSGAFEVAGDQGGEPDPEPDRTAPPANRAAAEDEWLRRDDPRRDDEPRREDELVAYGPAVRRRFDRDSLAVGAEEEDSEEPGLAGEYAAVSSERRAMWIPAVLLVVGLLGGLIAGYGFWGRPGAPAVDTEGGSAPGAAVSAGADEAAQPEAAQPEPVAPPPASAGTPAAPSSLETPPGTTPAAATGGREGAPAALGTLIIDSTPGGAGVTIDGTWRGRTPLKLEKLPLARYQVRVVEPGYTVAAESVTLSPGTPERTVAVRLEPQAPPAARGMQPAPRGTTATAPRGGKPAAARGAPAPAASPAEAFTGSIYVDSRPRGAAVAINGKPVGVTPLLIPEMRIGTHVVRLELPDHRIWSSTARVTAGQEVRVTGSLEPIQPIR